MKKINDGGRAFPWCGDLNDCPTINMGMTLRDYFAAKAMQGMFAADTNESVMPIERKTVEAYAMADAMIAAREADVEANIASVSFFTALDGVLGEAASNCDDDTRLGDIVYLDGTPNEVSLALLTFCVIVLKNGFTVTGESACASPSNFDAALGRKIARQNAIAKVLGGAFVKEADA